MQVFRLGPRSRKRLTAEYIQLVGFRGWRGKHGGAVIVASGAADQPSADIEVVLTADEIRKLADICQPAEASAEASNEAE